MDGIQLFSVIRSKEAEANGNVDGKLSLTNWPADNFIPKTKKNDPMVLNSSVEVH